LSPVNIAGRPAYAAWRPWLVWLPAALLFTYAFFHRVAPSVMIDPLMRDLGVGAAVLGNLSAFYFYAYAGLQIPVGMAVDRWGPRRVLTAAAAFCALGSLCFALSDTLGLLYLGRLMIGVGSAFGFVGALILAGRWFSTRRFALVSGLTMMVGMSGGILGQAPLAVVIDAVGWRAPLLGAAAAGGILALGIWTLVRDHPPGAAAKDPSHRGAGIAAALAEVLGQRQNWIIALIGAATSAPLLAFAGLWGVAWLMQVHGMTRPEAAATTSALLIGWALGAPLAGHVSDRLARRKPALIAATGGGLVCLSALLYVPGLPGAALPVLFFVTGLFLSAMVVCFAIMREINSGAVTGVALAFINMMVVAAGALFQPLIGALLDHNWDGALAEGAPIYSPGAYRAAFSVLVIILTAGLGAAFLVRETRASISS
jgi:MFS family permease